MKQEEGAIRERANGGEEKHDLRVMSEENL